jgi:hypothetical protein
MKYKWNEKMYERHYMDYFKEETKHIKPCSFIASVCSSFRYRQGGSRQKI